MEKFSAMISNLKDERGSYFTFYRFASIAFLFLLFVVRVIRGILLWLFPNLMQIGEINLHLLALGILISLFLITSKVKDSIRIDVIVKWTVKIFLEIIILTLAYFIYPEGITNTPIAMLTLGSIGRLIISFFLVMASIGLLFTDY
jgi:hypothetical protein